jgi:hypothetical protein
VVKIYVILEAPGWTDWMPGSIPGRADRWRNPAYHIYCNEEKRWCGLLPGSVLFRLVASPLRLGEVGPYPIWGVWFPSCFLLEGTCHTPTVAPEPSVERVAGAGHSMVGRIGTHMLL